METSPTASFYGRGVKRALDLVVASGLCLLLSPLMLVLAWLVKRQVGQPVIFRQRRIGYLGQNFVLHKFRTMTSARDEEGRLLPDDQRTTRLGDFLRRSSLDELPQLWDVLRGKMSLVGPRPLLLRYRHRYDERQWRRHEVRPGITGWAVVRGRNNQTWDAMFEADLEYVEKLSLSFDLKVAFLTLKTLFDRRGLERKTGETFEFWGREEPPPGLDVYAVGASEEL